MWHQNGCSKSKKIRKYLYTRKFNNKKILNPNYSGKNIFITGANSGIGLELTKKFLNLNNKVFVTYRNNSENLDKINSKNLTLIKCDQKNLSEIENIKKEITNIPINLLINSAGIFGPPEQKLETLNFNDFQKNIFNNLENNLNFGKAEEKGYLSQPKILEKTKAIKFDKEFSPPYTSDITFSVDFGIYHLDDYENIISDQFDELNIIIKSGKPKISLNF